MKTVFRIFIGLFILVIAAGAAGVAILMTTSPEEIRDFVAGQVKEATGRELAIKGKLDLGISLVPSLVMNDVTFANAKWASSPNMLSLKRLEAGLELMPLLQGDIRLTQIVLIEPNINLETNAKGQGSWVFEDATKPEAKKDESSGSATLPILNRLLIEKGKFTFKDRQKSETLSLALDKVKIDAAGPSGSTLIELKGGYNGTPFELTGGIASLYRLVDDPSSYSIDLTAKALAASVHLKGKIDRPLSEQKLDIRTTVIGADISNTVALAAKLVPQLGDLKLPKLGALNASLRVQGTPAAISLSDLKYAVGPTGSLEVSGGGKITGLPAKPVYAVSFAVKGNDLSQFSNIAGMKLPKAPPYEIAGIFRNPRGDYAVDNFKMKLGGTDVSGNVLASLKSKTPNITVALTSNNLDLADILAAAPQSDAPKEAVKKDDGRVFPNDPLPVDGLKSATVNLKFLGKKVILNGAPLTDLSLGLALKGGKLTLDPFQAEFAKGKMIGVIILDGSRTRPSLLIDFKAKGTDVGKLLKDMDVTDMLTGAADTTITLKGSGGSVRQIMAGLNGKTEIIMKDGTVATKYLDLIAADLVKTVMPGGADTTKINCLVNRFNIKQGIATNTAMVFDTEKMTISGGGKIDLRSEKLDLKIKPAPKDASLVSMAVPIDVGGTLKSPSALPSTTAVLKGIAGLALGPVGLLALTVSAGSSDKNPCLAALNKPKAKTAAQKAPPPQKSSNPVNSVTDAIGGGLKSLFGGK
ncbi:MAG: AsmA family protein [Rhodospirillaceae bacterium]|nr:AsmA family protein [Rhodospirillaceae bacterium]